MAPSPSVALIPHAALAYTWPCIDLVLGALPSGGRCLFLPNNHAGHRDWPGQVFDRTTFETAVDPGRTEHSYWWYADLLSRHWPDVTVAFPTWSGELGAGVDPRAFAVIVVSADLWHSVAGRRGQREAAWESDGQILSWLRGTAGTEPLARGSAGAGSAPTCAWPNLRAFARLRSLLGLSECAVVDYYSSSGVDPDAAPQARSRAAVQWRACWPVDDGAGPPRFVTYGGVVATDEAGSGAVAALGRQAALRCVHAAAFNKLSRLSPRTPRVPLWALQQLGLDDETAERTGMSGVFVTSLLPDTSTVWCCYGAIPPDRDTDTDADDAGAGAGAGFNSLLSLAVRRCATLDSRRTSEHPPSGPRDVTVTLLAPVETWRRAAEPVVAPAPGFSVGWGTVGRRWDGAIFLPSVWRENPGWTWEHLIQRLQEKRGRGTPAAPGQDAAWLVRSVEIGGHHAPPPAGPHLHPAAVVARAGRGKSATTTRRQQRHAAPGRRVRPARAPARPAAVQGPPDGAARRRPTTAARRAATKPRRRGGRTGVARRAGAGAHAGHATTARTRQHGKRAARLQH